MSDNRGRKVIAGVKLKVYKNGEFKEEWVNVECCPSNLESLVKMYTNVKDTLVGAY